MARQKEEVISMVDTFKEFKELKNIDRSTMISVLEDSFRNVLAKMFDTDENFDVIINPDKGDFEIWKNRTVVADDDWIRAVMPRPVMTLLNGFDVIDESSPRSLSPAAF